MKKIMISFLLICLYASSIAQTQLHFESVTPTPGIEKAELYKRARLWFAETFKDSKQVLEISDKETGELVGKGNFRYYSEIFVGSAATRGVINFTIKVTVKDGRYKYEIKDFEHVAYIGNENRSSAGYIYSDQMTSFHFIGGKKRDERIWEEMKSMCVEENKTISTSLQAAMNKPSPQDANDW